MWCICQLVVVGLLGLSTVGSEAAFTSSGHVTKSADRPATESRVLRRLRRADAATLSPEQQEEHDGIRHRITQGERLDLVLAHNKYRAFQGSKQTLALALPASDMKFLIYSMALERAAAYWANDCNYQRGFPPPPLEQFSQQGQNIYAFNATSIEDIFDLDAAVLSWFNEGRNFFTYGPPAVCAAGKTCDHYTQLMWANTTYFGCSLRYCLQYINHPSFKANVYHLVCNYAPPGNLVNVLPYTSGNFCTSCGPSFPACANKLCRTEPPCAQVMDCSTESLNTSLCLCTYSEEGGHVTMFSVVAATPNLLLLSSMSILSVVCARLYNQFIRGQLHVDN